MGSKHILSALNGAIKAMRMEMKGMQGSLAAMEESRDDYCARWQDEHIRAIELERACEDKEHRLRGYRTLAGNNAKRLNDLRLIEESHKRLLRDMEDVRKRMEDLSGENYRYWIERKKLNTELRTLPEIEDECNRLAAENTLLRARLDMEENEPCCT